MTVSFDLFGTLVTVERPANPGRAVERELRAAGIPVPDDWPDAFRESHHPVESGRESPLPTHVVAALKSRGIDASPFDVTRAVRQAFEPDVATRPGAEAAVDRARRYGPVAVCSNCAIPGLATRTLRDSKLDLTAFEAVVSSVDVGYLKPDRRAFEAVAGELGCNLESLVHVGDDPETDGGIEKYGGTAVLLTDHELAEIPGLLEELHP